MRQGGEIFSFFSSSSIRTIFNVREITAKAILSHALFARPLIWDREAGIIAASIAAHQLAAFDGIHTSE